MQRGFTQEMIDKARKIGPVFVINEKNNVMAVCTIHDFEKEEDLYAKKVEDGIISATEKMIITVPQTFTFSISEVDRRPIHVGTKTALAVMLATILDEHVDLINWKFDEENDLESFGKILKILFRRDLRLYIPFSGNYELIWKIYSRVSFEEALHWIISVVP